MPEEIEAALLVPAFEIGERDFVGRVEQRIIGREEVHGGIRVGDARGLAGHRCSVRHRGNPLRIALILDDERAALLDVVEQTTIRAHQIGTQVVSADADDDCVVAAEIFEGERNFVEQIDLNADLAERVGNRIVARGDVADAQVRGHDEIQHVDGDVGGLAPIARGQRGDGFERSGEFFAVELRERVQRIRAGCDVGRRGDRRSESIDRRAQPITIESRD